MIEMDGLGRIGSMSKRGMHPTCLNVSVFRSIIKRHWDIKEGISHLGTEMSHIGANISDSIGNLVQSFEKARKKATANLRKSLKKETLYSRIGEAA